MFYYSVNLEKDMKIWQTLHLRCIILKSKLHKCLKLQYLICLDLKPFDHCKGWICPSDQECSAQIEGNCKQSSCRINRFCKVPPLKIQNNSSNYELEARFQQPSSDEVPIISNYEVQKLNIL